MRTLIQIYSISRYPIAIGVCFLLLCCPIVAVSLGASAAVLSLIYLCVGPQDHDSLHDAWCVSIGICLGIIAIGIGSVVSYGLAQWLFGWLDPIELRNIPYWSTYAIFWLKFTVALVIFQILCTVRVFEAYRREYIAKNGDI